MDINLIFYFTWYLVNSVNNLMSNAISGKIMIYPVYVDIITVSGTIGMTILIMHNGHSIKVFW